MKIQFSMTFIVYKKEFYIKLQEMNQDSFDELVKKYYDKII
jgi:predicted CopG family antitoxin